MSGGTFEPEHGRFVAWNVGCSMPECHWTSNGTASTRQRASLMASNVMRTHLKVVHGITDPRQLEART